MQLDLPFPGRIQTPTESPPCPERAQRAAEPCPERAQRVEGPALSERKRVEGIQFVRIRRARRYILRVRPDGTLRVTVPRGGSRREAEAFVAENQKWIERERRRVGASTRLSVACWFPDSLRGDYVTIHLARTADGLHICYGDRRVACNRTPNAAAGD